MEYKGTVEKVIFTNNQWSSIRVRLENKKILTCVGQIINPMIGYSIVLKGDMVDDPIYGLQLKVLEYQMKKASNDIGIIAYLSSGLIKGIGEELAKRIVKCFGEKAIDIIENEPERLKEVPGISDKKIASIAESHKKNNSFTALYELLGGKVTINQAAKIIEKYGDQSVSKIKKNPYILIYDIDGIGFLKADAIAKASGIATDSIDRVCASLIYILKVLSETDGHCFATAHMIQERILDMLITTPEFITDMFGKQLKRVFCENGLWELERDKVISDYKLSSLQISEIDNWLQAREQMVYKTLEAIGILKDEERIIIDGSDIYWKKLYDAEVEVAKNIADMCREKPVKKIDETAVPKAFKYIESIEGYSLEDEQKFAAIESLKNRVTVITGGPGRGKSTIIKTILEIWDDDDSVILCAPTGKASQRMREVTGRYAETIHRVKINNPPCNGLVIVDESSMIDITLASELVSWARNCNVVFVGDADQLPSIGPGSFFLSLIKSPIVPTIKLIKGHRNFGSIAMNAENINNGRTMKEFSFDESFKYIPASDDVIKDIIIKEYLKLREKYGESNACVLAPMRNKTNSAVNVLNNAIREIVNPYKPNGNKLTGCKYREGDRVMQTRNMYQKEVFDADNNMSYGVFNGDCGTVTLIDEYENSIKIIFDDGRTAMYEKHEAEDLILAYAMTIHKSQGSEYKGVIVVHSKGHYVMLLRNLLYTAVTRAKSEVILIGDKSSFNNASTNYIASQIGEVIRNTKLVQRISAL